MLSRQRCHVIMMVLYYLVMALHLTAVAFTQFL
jgi:hypothetical protein